MTALSELPEAVLDTDTLSLYRRAHAQVTRHAAAYSQRYGQLTFTELTRYEVLRGLTAAHATTQLAAFERFCRLHRTLPFDAEAARRDPRVHKRLSWARCMFVLGADRAWLVANGFVFEG